MILPSLVFPTGVFLMRAYIDEAISNEIIDAGRVDGAGEFHRFSNLAFRMLMPGFTTVLILAFVANWNNYFLPLVVLNSPVHFPVTVGLANWYATAVGGTGGVLLYTVVMAGSLVSDPAGDRCIPDHATLLAGRLGCGRGQGMTAIHYCPAGG